MAAAPLPNFENTIVPHLSAAYNLARWITRNSHDAEDLAQEAYMKAFRFFDGFRGADGRGWLLAIVRNTCLTYIRKARALEPAQVFDERIHSASGTDAERDLLWRVDSVAIRECIDELPAEYRDVLILREIREFSYKEIGEAVGAPIGTVMSRLSRARRQLEIRLDFRRVR